MHNRPPNRPGLEWEVLAVFTVDPAEPVPTDAPEHVKAKARRRAACQVSMAAAGFDHKLKIDRVEFSYRMGWDDNGTFVPLNFIPHRRGAEFLAALTKALAEAAVLHANAQKKAQGKLAASIREQVTK